MLVIPEARPRANERLVGGMFPIVSGLTGYGGGKPIPRSMPGIGNSGGPLNVPACEVPSPNDVKILVVFHFADRLGV
jgi:hypothetical protein